MCYTHAWGVTELVVKGEYLKWGLFEHIGLDFSIAWHCNMETTKWSTFILAYRNWRILIQYGSLIRLSAHISLDKRPELSIMFTGKKKLKAIRNWYVWPIRTRACIWCHVSIAKTNFQNYFPNGFRLHRRTSESLSDSTTDTYFHLKSTCL